MFDFAYVRRLMRAGFTYYQVATSEYVRMKRSLAEFTKELSKEKAGEDWDFVSWDCHAGGPGGKQEDVQAFISSLLTKKRTIALITNAHWVLKPAPVIQLFLNALYDLNAAGVFVMINTLEEIPRELKPYVTQIEFRLPNEDDLKRIWGKVLKDNGVTAEIEAAPIFRVARGLTHYESESSFAVGLISSARKNPKGAGYTVDEAKLLDSVLREKEKAIKQTGILEIFEPKDLDFDKIGGLEVLKQYLRKRSRAFSKEAREWGLPKPKGALALGIPGTGKTMCAKACAAVWQVPLVICSIGKLFGSLMGQSEGLARQLTRTLDSVGPCVAMFDEMEKGFAGIGGSGQTDSGVAARVLGHLLTWGQDRGPDSEAYIFATANDVTKLLNSAPEILRKGRFFDEIFWVDLPNRLERKAVLRIIAAKYKRALPEEDLDELADATDKFTGAELEGAFTAALYDAFDENGEVTAKHILRAVKQTKTLVQLDPKKMEDMRAWAQGRCVFASEPTQPATEHSRKVAIA